ncbi:hypothetical protein CEXT_398731 [Caerostris extrusa]|uniref:Uncharacterized protein n=1 Tax=Caerostris extrusa TaxID=172846 RepID=A0AAV4PPN8_CAEEX|nr:hypothetical protein CEXT_398731 [Caerostris extrusa]
MIVPLSINKRTDPPRGYKTREIEKRKTSSAENAAGRSRPPRPWRSAALILSPLRLVPMDGPPLLSRLKVALNGHVLRLLAKMHLRMQIIFFQRLCRQGMASHSILVPLLQQMFKLLLIEL